MWTRKELKEQGKYTFKLNYWKCVLVALIISLIAGGSCSFSFSPGMFSFNGNGFNGNKISKDIEEDITDDLDDALDDLDDAFDDIDDAMDDINDELNINGKIDGNDFNINLSDEDIADIKEAAGAMTGAAVGAAIAAFVFVFLIVFIIVFAIVLALNAFIFNPLTVGGMRFFTKNLDEPSGVGHIGYAFDHNYKNIALTMFFRDLYTFLWSLLFIIPGIVKSYEYRMIPYLLAEDPNMTKEQAFELSKQMMTGNKWKAFVLDLSFIGWHILGALTLGILEIFYIAPYQLSTNAALYRKLLSLTYGGPGYAQPQDAYYQPQNAAPVPEEEKVYYGQPDYTQPEFVKYDNVTVNTPVNEGFDNAPDAGDSNSIGNSTENNNEL